MPAPRCRRAPSKGGLPFVSFRYRFGFIPNWEFLKISSEERLKFALGSSYAGPMPETAESLPTSAASFATLLASHAAQPPRITEWNDEALADDVATLSYEQAVRTHSRFRREDFPTLSSEEKIESTGKAIAAAMKSGSGSKAAPDEIFAAPRQQASSRPSPLEESRRSTSITIRLSRAEYEQLHERAAEAGMTASAYLRSCTFEAEALRAQVKETLAKYRSAAPAESKPEASEPVPARPESSSRRKPPARAFPSWWSLAWTRLVPQRSGFRGAAQA